MGVSIKKLIQMDMRIISRRTLREFWEKHADTEQSLKNEEAVNGWSPSTIYKNIVEMEIKKSQDSYLY